jgi:sec-independent protein translocase protein TatB
VVIGPERLPRVARTLGHLFGRLQRYVAQVKSDINREVDLSELQRVKAEVENTAYNIKSGIESEVREAEKAMQSVEADIERQLGGQQLGPATSDPGLGPAGEEPQPSADAPKAPATASPQLELGIDEPVPAEAPGRGSAAPERHPAAAP